MNCTTSFTILLTHDVNDNRNFLLLVDEEVDIYTLEIYENILQVYAESPDVFLVNIENKAWTVLFIDRLINVDLETLINESLDYNNFKEIYNYLIETYSDRSKIESENELWDALLYKLISNLDPVEGIYFAAFYGFQNLAQNLIDQGGDPNDGLIGAAKGGHRNIVELTLANGATDYDGAMIKAARWGHRDIVKLMLYRTITNPIRP